MSIKTRASLASELASVTRIASSPMDVKKT